MADYINIEPKEINHPVTGDLLGVATWVKATALVETDVKGNTVAKGFFDMKDDLQNSIPFGSANIQLSLTGWSGDITELEAQVLNKLGVTVI